MLTITCAACKTKLWRYEKIGHGHVVRCHKDRITKWFKAKERDHKVYCTCGKPIGVDKESHFRMIKGAFSFTGTKSNKR